MRCSFDCMLGTRRWMLGAHGGRTLRDAAENLPQRGQLRRITAVLSVHVQGRRQSVVATRRAQCCFGLRHGFALGTKGGRLIRPSRVGPPLHHRASPSSGTAWYGRSPPTARRATCFRPIAQRVGRFSRARSARRCAPLRGDTRPGGAHWETPPSAAAPRDRSRRSARRRA